jgi:hypothetical protein
MSAVALQFAAQNNHIDCLKMLIAAECPMSSQAIEEAASSGNVECLQLLIAAKCPFDYLAIELAASRGRVQCVQALIDAGSPICVEAFIVAVNCCEMLPSLNQSGLLDYDGDWENRFRVGKASTINYIDDDADTKKNKLECLKLLVATGQFDHQKGFVSKLYNSNGDCHGVLTQAGFPWNRRVVVRQEKSIADLIPENEIGDDEFVICAKHWSDEELNTAFARKWIWTAEDIDDELKQRVDKLKAKKAEIDHVAIQSCTILPVDVVKHVLCSYF